MRGGRWGQSGNPVFAAESLPEDSWALPESLFESAGQREQIPVEQSGIQMRMAGLIPLLL